MENVDDSVNLRDRAQKPGAEGCVCVCVCVLGYYGKAVREREKAQFPHYQV